MSSKDTEIKNYWNERADKAFAQDLNPQATTDDVYLRNLEISTLKKAILELQGKQLQVLDVGCGDGFTTIEISSLPNVAHVVGVDYSESMIKSAMKRKISGDLSNIDFLQGDVNEIDLLFSKKFDIIISNRCLINLTSWEMQQGALKKIHSLLSNNGAYFATENFLGGQLNLNNLRGQLGLNEIPIRWHNLYYNESDYLDYANSLFKGVDIINFSSTYYYISRGVYSKYCLETGEDISYHHALHKIAVEFPTIGDFSPIKFVKHFR